MATPRSAPPVAPVAPGPPVPPAPGAVGDDLNLRILHSLGACLTAEHGPEAFARACAAAGLELSDFDERTRWISLEQCEAFLAEARTAFDSDEAFRDACAYEYRHKSYGPMLALIRGTSPWSAYVLSVRYMPKLVTHIGRFEHERNGSHGVLRYTSTRAESHLMCLPRLGQIMAVPTLWGLPPVRVDHPQCIGRGDPCCEYRFRLLEPVRWLPAALGLVFGGGLVAAVHAWLGPVGWAWLLPWFGLLVGAAVEYRRASRSNLELALDTQKSIAELAVADAEARSEILAFQQRQRDWSRLLEEQIAERVGAQQRVVEEIRALEVRRLETVRAFSHDLRNPLTVLTASSRMLQQAPGQGGLDAGMLDDMVLASDEMAQLIANLMPTLSSEAAQLQLSPREMEVPPLVERLRRRLNALCYQRGVRTSTFSTREAPACVVVDELLFDRVVDNLLTNAAKYTERGSILVEVGGTPGFLTIKISDTGRGIAEEDIERVFQPQGSAAGRRALDSYGLGLSVVVELLAQAGGKLEVMSKPGVGTTFWAHFPVNPPEERPVLRVLPGGQTRRQLVDSVVTIRKVHG